MSFAHRAEAGRRLADALSHQTLPAPPVVLGLPRGGVAVAAPVAQRLHAPLDVVLVRKLGAPEQPELALGAISESGVRVFNTALMTALSLREADLAPIIAREQATMAAREHQIRAQHPAVPLAGRTAIIVDDGIATGATAMAAIRAVWAAGARSVILAVPVIAAQSVTALSAEVDSIVSLACPKDLVAVGHWYQEFSQVTDEDVLALLTQARHRMAENRDSEQGVCPLPTPDADR